MVTGSAQWCRSKDDHGAGVPEWTPAGVCILGWSMSRCQAKFQTCEISNFTTCTHAQNNILHTKYADKSDFYGLGIDV